MERFRDNNRERKQILIKSGASFIRVHPCTKLQGCAPI